MEYHYENIFSILKMHSAIRDIIVAVKPLYKSNSSKLVRVYQMFAKQAGAVPFCPRASRRPERAP